MKIHPSWKEALTRLNYYKKKENEKTEESQLLKAVDKLIPNYNINEDLNEISGINDKLYKKDEMGTYYQMVKENNFNFTKKSPIL